MADASLCSSSPSWAFYVCFVAVVVALLAPSLSEYHGDKRGKMGSRDAFKVASNLRVVIFSTAMEYDA